MTIKYFIILSMMYWISRDSVIQAKPPDRLTGGDSTTLTVYPFHVSVFFNHHVMCAASIISPRHILTSASCVLLKVDDIIIVVGNLQVIAGSTDVHNSRGLREFYQVDTVFWHENYMPRYFWKNDIAILKLEKAITFLPTRSSIDLPNHPLRPNAILNLINWGDDPSSMNDDKYLQHLYLIRQSSFQCQKIMSLFILNYNIQGCATTISIINSGITVGDSGAGLIYDSQVVGIVTGILRDKPRILIYTDVYSYLDFINTILAEH